KALYSALTTAAVGIVAYFALQPYFDSDSYGIRNTLLLGVVAVVVGVVVGLAYGGFDKGLSARTAGITALLIS
ncbi:MAG TPA: hypothetical protein PLV68_21590, partial [Ilumatobacteraceae bacterium]|nr:hypothetical protein [Ilumatobacteraceae bacterium]